MSNALLIRKPDLSVALTEDAVTLKSEALEAAALIGKVTNAEEQEIAVAAARKIKEVLDLVEKARKAAKEPFLRAGQALDDAVKAFRVDLENEWGRLTQDLIGPFQRDERRRADLERQRQEAELRRIEAERQADLAKAKTAEAKQLIEDRAAQQTAVVEKPVAPIKAVGQVVKDDWDIQVTNPYDLAKYHPDCVNITPRLSEIKAALNQGRTLRGIVATNVIKSSVRAPREREALVV